VGCAAFSDESTSGGDEPSPIAPVTIFHQKQMLFFSPLGQVEIKKREVSINQDSIRFGIKSSHAMPSPLRSKRKVPKEPFRHTPMWTRMSEISLCRTVRGLSSSLTRVVAIRKRRLHNSVPPPYPSVPPFPGRLSRPQNLGQSDSAATAAYAQATRGGSARRS
jgi:hypothetical protein